MKKTYISFVIGLIIFITSSCEKENFLDQTVTTDLNEETVFTDSTRTMNFLNGIYSDMAFSFSPTRFGSGGLEAASDEAEGSNPNPSSKYFQFALGSINANSVPNDAWNTSYANIRRVNQLLKHLPTTPLSGYLREQIMSEARFLRAWYYAILLKHYGGVPLVGDIIYGANDDIIAKRNTYEECLNYIVSECEAAFQVLPPAQLSQNYGRITQGACLALRARVLLYAASPLFNGGGIEQGNQIIGYPNYSAERWKIAADAAKDFMNFSASLGEPYMLNENNTTAPGYGFYQVFTLRKNTEYILHYMRESNRDLESIWLPPSRGAVGNHGSYAYQDLVDAFPMKNGKAITDPQSGYDASNPYANRDPRLNYTIIHNESLIHKRDQNMQPVYTYVRSGEDAVYIGTPTGYFINKMLKDDIVANNVHGTPRALPLMRYAEVLLNYAEAQNEYAGPGLEVYAAVEAIRKRAGLNPYHLPTGLSKEQMREVIRNERRIELAFEEHRFWDVRRWKIAETTDNQQMRGIEISRPGNSYNYKTFVVREHTFRPEMYLWPIPQSEIVKSEELIQNPGW